MSMTASNFVYSKAHVPSVEEKRRMCGPLIASLKNMLNCSILKSPSYVVFALTGATSASGMIIVMTYQQDRAQQQGFDSDTATYFIMTFGAANTVWRLMLGVISVMPGVNNLRALTICTLIGGVATLVSGLNLSLPYQYMFSILCGLSLGKYLPISFVSEI